VSYYESLIGIEVFWPSKYLSLNDEVFQMVIEQCHMIMDGVNNLLKKRVSCKDNVLAKSFRAKNISDVENMGNRIEDLCNEELDGEMSYIFEDGVEGSIGESRFDSMNEEGNEKNIVEGNEEVGNKENFE